MEQASQSTRRKLLVACAWVAGAFLFASQWCLYDATRHAAEPFRYYLGWAAYMWAVLTPLAVRLARRWPLDGTSWKGNLLNHVAASAFLTALQLIVEASFGWWRHADLSLQDALRHYFTQHTQMSLLTYWVLVGGMTFRALYDQSRLRALRSSQLEAKLAHMRLDALRGQLQPHFLFNTLQAATTLIYEDPEGAEETLLCLSELLRLSLEALHEQEAPLENEIQFLKYYIAIQQRRFGDRLSFEIEAGSGLAHFAVPSLLLQPLVENAIRHGIGKHSGEDLISVRAYHDNNQLHLEIRNRNSILEDSPEPPISRGVGLANSIARLEQLYGSRQSFQIRRLAPRGVEVAITVPARLWAPESLAGTLQEAV